MLEDPLLRDLQKRGGRRWPRRVWPAKRVTSPVMTVGHSRSPGRPSTCWRRMRNVGLCFHRLCCLRPLLIHSRSRGISASASHCRAFNGAAIIIFISAPHATTLALAYPPIAYLARLYARLPATTARTTTPTSAADPAYIKPPAVITAQPGTTVK